MPNQGLVDRARDFATAAHRGVGQLRKYTGQPYEEHLRRATILSRGDMTPFFTRPISLAFMLGTALVFVLMVRSAASQKRPHARRSEAPRARVGGARQVGEAAAR